MRDPDRGWDVDARPARAHEVPGQMPRAPYGVGPAGAECDLDDRVRELAAKGWRIDAASAYRVQLSRPSYWLPAWATALLGLVTFGAWWVFAAWLHGSRRRDERLLTVLALGPRDYGARGDGVTDDAPALQAFLNGPRYRLVEQYTRGW